MNIRKFKDNHIATLDLEFAAIKLITEILNVRLTFKEVKNIEQYRENNDDDFSIELIYESYGKTHLVEVEGTAYIDRETKKIKILSVEKLYNIIKNT